MAKKHIIYRLHKVKVHRNRWLIWALVYALIVTIVLVWYITLTNVNYEEEPAVSQFQVWHTYSNKPLGFSLRYPSTWAVESERSSVFHFVPNDSRDEGVSITVGKPSDENAFRKILHIQNETPTTLDNVPAREIINYIGANNTETIIIATHQNKLYILRGSDDLLRKLLLTFNFISTPN
jgi:hypothetical protein